MKMSRTIEVVKKVVTYEISNLTFDMFDNEYEVFKEYLKTLEVDSEDELFKKIYEYLDKNEIKYYDLEYDTSLDTEEIINDEVIGQHLELNDYKSSTLIKKYK